MGRPTAAVVAALATGALVACTSPPQTPLASTASVTVNGIVTKFDVVKCTQVQWYRTIHIGGNLEGATVVMDGRADRAIAESVRIQSVGGFTGMYSQGDGSEPAKVGLNGGKFTISGSAQGSMADKPNEPATATFKIFVTC